jgi:hypothetical protein
MNAGSSPRGDRPVLVRLPDLARANSFFYVDAAMRLSLLYKVGRSRLRMVYEAGDDRNHPIFIHAGNA